METKSKKKTRSQKLTPEQQDELLKFSEFMNRGRLEHNLHINEFSHNVGISSPYLARVERAITEFSPSFAMVIRIVDALGYEIRYVKKKSYNV